MTNPPPPSPEEHEETRLFCGMRDSRQTKFLHGLCWRGVKRVMFQSCPCSRLCSQLKPAPLKVRGEFSQHISGEDVLHPSHGWGNSPFILTCSVGLDASDHLVNESRRSHCIRTIKWLSFRSCWLRRDVHVCPWGVYLHIKWEERCDYKSPLQTHMGDGE